MSFYKKNRLLIATAAYWFLLAYILAALVFWFIELQTQNQRMTNFKEQELKPGEIQYEQKLSEIQKDKERKTAQYIGEGSIFLLVILIGAIFLYRAVMRQIRIQQQQQNFMMAITHELKTPIAVTRLNLETLQKYKLDEGRQQKIIQSALQETDRLNTLANNILVSAQLESGHYQIAAETVNLSELILKTVTDFRNRLPDTLWDAQVSPQLTVTGDGLLLQILVNNLIGNALKYSPKGSVITVILKKDQENIYLKVRDQGSGIPPQEKKRVFQKFYRIGNEETRTTQGTGLGLYLCKKIATDHQATITVSDNEPSGSEFTVIFHSNS